MNDNVVHPKRGGRSSIAVVRSAPGATERGDMTLDRHQPLVMPRHLAFIAVVFLVTIASRCSTALADDAEARQQAVKPFEPAVVISGTARQRGVAYGRQFKEAIREFSNVEIDGERFRARFKKADMLAYAAECGKVVREYCPMVADEIEGIAEGAGLDVNDVLLIQLHEELWHGNPLPTEHGHCTVLAVHPSVSGDGKAYLAQSWDWMVSRAGTSFMTEWNRDEGEGRAGKADGDNGTRVLAYGYGGMPFGAGMNSHGLALCWTSAAMGNRGQSPRVGVPSYSLIAHLLNQKDLDAVVREAERIPNAGWFTFVVTDSRGRIVNIEGSTKGVACERSEHYLVRADYGSEAKQTEMATDVPRWKSPARCEHFRTMIDKDIGHVNSSRIRQIYENPKLGIAVGGPGKNVSIDVMLFDTTARKAWFSRGPNYGIEWREFSIGQ